MKNALLAILAILPALAIPAFADEVQFPVLTTDGLTGMDISTFYPSNSTYTVQIVLQYQVENPLEVPTYLTWVDEEGATHIINLNDDFVLIHYPQQPEVDTKAQDELDRIDQILDDKKLEMVEAQPELDKYRLCLEEFKNDYPVKFAAWERIGSLTEFELTYQQTYTDHPTVAETNANKKHQECEVRKIYPFVGAYEANKGLDLNPDHSTTDMELTMSTPTTAEDIRQAQIIAEAFQCSEKGKSQGLCKDYLAGEEYLIPKPRVPDWYNQYRELAAESVDTQVSIDHAMLTQCENYYPLYAANDAIELPTWLRHCVP